MKLKCIIHEYYDLVLDRYIKQDEIIEVRSIERANFLLDVGWVEKIEDKKEKASK